MDQSDLRSALIGKLQELDLTQREAAEAIGVSQQALSSWVSGDSIPSRRQSPRLAKWLDLPEETVRKMRLKAAAENQHGDIGAPNTGSWKPCCASSRPSPPARSTSTSRAASENSSTSCSA